MGQMKMMRINPINLYIKASPSFSGGATTTKEKQEEMKKRRQTLTDTFNGAIEEQRQMHLDDVANKTGLSINEIRGVLKRNKTIRDLWHQVKPPTPERLTKEEAEKRRSKIGAVLSDAKANGVRLTVDEVAALSGLERGATVYQIESSDALQSLWFWVKTKDESHFTQEEVEVQTKQIEEQLKLAIEQKKAITINEIVEATGIEYGVVENRINADDDLSKLRDETLAFEDKNYKYEVSEIKKVLEEAKTNGLKVTQVYISQKTGIQIHTVQKRISQNSELDRLFEKVRAREHSTNTKEEMKAQNAQIAAVLNKAIEEGRKMTVAEVAKQIKGLKQGTAASRMYNNPDLYALWEQVKSDDNTVASKDEIEEQKAKIETILTELKSRNEKISLAQLAKKVGGGATRRVVHTRIQSSKTLSSLWQSVQPVSNAAYTEEEVEVQNEIIKRILAQRIHDKTKPSISQMSEYLDLSREIVKRRIEANSILSTLWETSQKPQ